ncbi:hypothetical protein RND81_12G146000 [Saponaria officinalis]|uniref:CCHC-type domain-containing protein n=1 Tax=Saponaria officinalis TaxID=3572 RepID=A0AAW1HAL7_SAPOF
MESKYAKCLVFNGEDYGQWKNMIMHFIKGIDYQCWLVIIKGPFEITVTKDGVKTEKDESDYSEADFKIAEKNSRAIALLQAGIGPHEYNRISGCTTAKEIWESLELAYEGTSRVKSHRIDLLMQQYETFIMNKDESIHSMSARFSSITNELKNLGRKLDTEDLVRKILRSLTDRWQPKVTAIEEAKDLSKLSYQELLGSLMAHEMSLNKRLGESSKGNGIALKAESSDTEEDFDDGLLIFAKRFKGSLKGILGTKRPTTNKKPFSGKQLPFGGGCFKCGDNGHAIKDCPQWRDIKSKEKRERTKNDYKNVMLAACWGELDSDEDWGDEDQEANMCLTVIPKTQDKPRSMKQDHVCLMGNSIDSGSDDEDEESEEVSFALLKAQVKTFSKVKLVPLFEQVLDEFYVKSNENKELRVQINEIAEENVLMKRKLKKQKSSLTVDQTVLSEQTSKIESLMNEVSNLKTELEYARKQFSHDKQTLINQHDVIRIEHDKMQIEFDTILKEKDELVKSNESLTDQLTDANRIARKWETSAEVLNFLNNHADHTLKNGLGYPTYNTPKRFYAKSNPTDRDFRKRKYVCLPEYLICTFCGKNGHLRYDCKKKENNINKNVNYKSYNEEISSHASQTKVTKKVWIRKDLLPSVTNKKGPNLVWVPKSRN